MKDAFTAVLVMGTVMLLSGCGTCMRGQMQGVYRGTKMDGMFLFLGVSPASIVGDAHMNCAAEIGVRGGYVLGGFVDLPISLMTDTVCLPYDITQDRKRIALWKASLRPLERILTECVPPGAEVLDRPQGDARTWFLHPNPTVMLPGLGLDWTVTGRTGTERRYRYPGEPGSHIVTFEIEDQDGNIHLLVIRVRNTRDQNRHNQPSEGKR